jgi:hypothetical protein
MTKPSPIALIVLCIVAVSILAFTINDQFGNRKHKFVKGINKAANTSLFLTHNPPHGQPGHNHNLPDGAPLTNISSAPATQKLNAPLLNNIIQPTTEINSTGLNPPHGQPGHNCAIAVGAPLNSAPATTLNNTTTSSGKNPPHGQPGHRCDIAVGAPLNSLPAKATTTTTSVATNTATINSSGALNPAHGQPGHRCDIAVGAPLNSPAKSNAVTTTNNKTLNSSLFPNYNFGQTDSAVTGGTPQFEYDSTGAALNPPHGQPGHDCAIAVGKPLKK